jgi:putative endonuclease
MPDVSVEPALSAVEWARDDRGNFIASAGRRTEKPPPLCHFDRSPDARRDGAEKSSLDEDNASSAATCLDRAWRDRKSVVSYNSHMSGGKTYYVYIMANQSRTLYIGLTNNIKRRVFEHKNALVEGFTCRYKIDTLVYVESFGDVYSAIAREKQIKHWRREKKLQLIAEQNPDWRDLSDGW